MTDRLETLRHLAESAPDDPLPRYAVAMEHRRLGDLDAAEKAFAEVRAHFPDYLPAYLIHGQVLEAVGREADAREAYAKGLDLARRAGEDHAASELAAALEAL